MQVTYDTSSFAQQPPDTVQLGVRGVPHWQIPPWRDAADVETRAPLWWESTATEGLV